MTDGIILQRYVELDGSLRKVMVVAKMRGFDHDKGLRLYDIDADGIVIGEPLTDHQGVLIGKARRVLAAD